MTKSNKTLVYEYIKRENAQGEAKIDTQSVSQALQIHRANASSILNELVRENKITKTNTRPVYYALKDQEEKDPFADLVGHRGSLLNAIQLAKAAIHYPNQSLNTLIVGEEGSGKSFFANTMFAYAKSKHIVDKSKQLYTLNCRHFVNNLEDFKVLVFDRTNNMNLDNILYAAQGSFLLIDNIHLLDGKSISRLVNFIDKGVMIFRDGSVSEKLNVTLLITANDTVQSNFMGVLKEKIPVNIALPKLNARPYLEKFDLINRFFQEEAMHTNFNIEIEPNVMFSLLSVESPLNIKFLKGAIKIAVAKAYLRSYDQRIQSIKVKYLDFDEKVQDALLDYRLIKEEINKVIPARFDYYYNKDSSQFDLSLTYKNLYEYIQQNVSKKEDKFEVDVLVKDEIIKLIAAFQEELDDAEIDINKLSKIVDVEIIKMVQRFVENSAKTLDKFLPSSIIYGLSLHINGVLNSPKKYNYLSDVKKQSIQENHPKEYELARYLAKEISEKYQVDLDENEIGIISIFLSVDRKKKSNQSPQILIAMHGESTAHSMANVINALVKENNTHAFDLGLDKRSEEAYQELKSLVLKVDEGKGLIVIYDMGSIKVFLDRIVKETGVEIRMIYLPLTLVGLEASRKAAMEEDLDHLYHHLQQNLRREMNFDESDEMALIALCHTGEGGAKQIKEYLHKNYRKDIKIIAIAQSDRKRLANEVQKIRQYYDVKAFIGTFDPKLFGIPFIPVSKIFEQDINKLDALLLSNVETKAINYNSMIDYLIEESKLDKDKLKETLPNFIEHLDILYGLNVDQKVGLFLHTGALVYKLQENQVIVENEKTEWYLKFRKEDMDKIRNALKKLETSFKVIIPDSEIARMVEIVEKGEGN